jgi:hypothetical protein
MHTTAIGGSPVPALLMLAIVTAALGQTAMPARGCLAGMLGFAAGLG